MGERDTKQVIVMRTDLNMRKGKMIAQGAHASNGASRLVERYRNEPYVAWTGSGQTKICVRVDSEEELMRVHRAAHAADLPVYLVTDAGHTEFHGIPTRTCLAIGPYYSDQVDVVTGELRLL